MNRKDIPDALLLEVEANCDVTWRDDATDTKFRSIIAGGMAYINDKLGETADYEADGYPWCWFCYHQRADEARG